MSIRKKKYIDREEWMLSGKSIPKKIQRKFDAKDSLYFMNRPSQMVTYGTPLTAENFFSQMLALPLRKVSVWRLRWLARNVR